ncbi:hypothetical protein TNCV_3780841 [Trichonephila clavipes]|nr:hypothetical protein TNCV_3780841 [Trichonephila clavipes]
MIGDGPCNFELRSSNEETPDPITPVEFGCREKNQNPSEFLFEKQLNETIRTFFNNWDEKEKPLWTREMIQDDVTIIKQLKLLKLQQTHISGNISQSATKEEGEPTRQACTVDSPHCHHTNQWWSSQYDKRRCHPGNNNYPTHKIERTKQIVLNSGAGMSVKAYYELGTSVSIHTA